MVEWGWVWVARARLGTDNVISTVERGERAYFPLSFLNLLFPVFDANEFLTCLPLPLAYTMSNTAVIWL